eukprot:gb/GECG01007797.1/.p1 GENE.gb/GECG01007797.1/~~gb/GECG01007797.1/.p1  ORF type:complete len:373 (+),score=41.54 gb/GECG01007797.1/:1-1119(+)
MSADKYNFRVEWQEPHSGRKRKFNLCYFKEDGAVELFDVQNRKTFLKRTVPPEDVELEEFFVGNYVTVLSRPLYVEDYLDHATKEVFSKKRGKTCGMVKPDAYPFLGEILQEAADSGLDLGRMTLIEFSRKEAEEFYKPRRDFAEYEQMCDLLTRDATVVFELTGDDAVAKWQELMGPRDPSKAREVAPNSIRARYGSDSVQNAVHGSLPEDVEYEINYIFEKRHSQPLIFDNCTAVIIKPHAVKARNTGNIIDAFLKQDMEICGIRLLAIDKHDAADLFEGYKGVVPEHPRWIDTVTEGKSVVLLIRGDNIVERVRELCGPYDTSIAQVLEPDSIRAKYGIDSARNAVHCTDLPDFGPLEAKFLFSVVGQS